MSQSLVNSLTPFHGNKNEDINFFLSQIEQLASLEKWPSEKKLIVLKLNLRDNALKVVTENSNLSQCDDFEHLAKELRNKFERKINFIECQNEFNKLSQEINQTVKDLAEKVELATQNFINPNKVHDPQIIELEEKLKLSKFLSALRPEIRLEVQKLGPKSFKEAINSAKNIEMALNDETAHCNSVSKFDLSQILNQQLETNKQILELSNKINSLSNQEVQVNNLAETASSSSYIVPKQNEVKCHICFKNHLTTNCWYFPTQQNVTYNYPNNTRYSRSYSRGNYKNYGHQENRNKQSRNNFHPYNRNFSRGGSDKYRGLNRKTRNNNNSNLN